ncbi:hypothetical protein TSUD_19250 [Trifolium subterraneum]|uniref:PWWP domain-containing protein n=1 Tax=Trifolium subterraneum TaxID=3900 RepID=A0A2Z6N5G9_TRISU|nr:hypothetical protein TSUD_19250 [Trifolium subterraneum]
MEEPEKGLSNCGISETLDVSVGGQVKVVEESGVCNGQDEVVCGGDSVKGGENLSEDVKSVEVGDGTEVQFEDSRVVGYEEGGSENAVVELGSVASESEVRDEAVVVETTPGDFIMEDAAGDLDREVTNTSCDNILGCSVTGSSVGGENVQCESEGKEKQEDGNVIGHGIPEDGNDVIVTFPRFHAEVEIEEKLNSNGEQPIGNDKVDVDPDDVHEVVYGTGVEIDKTLLNSDENQSSINEKCNANEQVIADKDVGASDAGQSDVHEGMQVDVVDQQGTERSKSAEIKDNDACSPVGAGTSENLDANAIEEKDTQITEQVGSNEGQEIEEESNEAGQRKPADGKAAKHALVKPGISEIVNQARYSLPTEKKEGEFSLSDMVWGKVRSHPWWPGQIFDPSDASERAMKYHKKDCYFVAYFGDRTFAWNEASQLKHFRAHFSTIEKQRSSSESFQNAIDCALDEVSRRVEYGLACSCIPKDTYDTIKSQTIENTGIRQNISLTHGVDESLNANSFSPKELIDYVKTLSELPTAGFDRLELTIAQAQLLAFNRFKGFSCLPEIQHCGGGDKDNSFVDDEQDLCEVIEHDQAGPRNSKKKGSTRQKRKHNFKDTMHPTKKEKRMSDLMNGTPDSPDGDSLICFTPENLDSPEHSKKSSASDPYANDSEMQDGRKTISVAKVSNTTKSSFNLGDCIRRAASQLTSSPSILKCSSDRSPKTDGDVDDFPENGLDVSLPPVEDDENMTEYSSLDDLLSSLQCVAQEPLEEYTFLSGIVSFFSDFRNSVIVAADWKDVLRTEKVGTKRKRPPPIAGTGSPETFEFEDMSDTYWTDRVIDNGNEEKPVQQPSRKNQKNDEQLVAAKSPKPAAKTPKPAKSPKPAKTPKPAQVNRRPYNKKKNSDSNHAETPEKPSGYIDENAPAELVMNFAEFNSVPLETNLNKMFRRFGPLKESETEVDRVSSRARVVFKKCVDAEVAFNSAKKFNIFGSVLVNYQLNYTPSALFKASSVDATQDQEMLLDLSNFDVNMV